MAKIEINKTELVWPGKYNEDGTLVEVPHVSLPFQVIESINESRATREANKLPQQGMLFDVYEGKEGDTFEAGWRNKLIWGDNLLVMGSLLEKFAGKIDLIYIDPPFATGADFSFSTEIGEKGEEITKEQSVIEEKAYRDTWGKDGELYPQWIFERIVLLKNLLSRNGSFYLHCDPTMSAVIRLICDEIFGKELFRNEIAWHYQQGTKPERDFGRKHDTIFRYVNGDSWIYNQLRLPTTDPERYKYKDEHGRNYVLGGTGMQTRYYADEARPCDDVWTWLDKWDPNRVNQVNQSGHERVGYATQKPEALLERIIKASSNEGDLVADFFCGSGTTLAVAEKLGRRWIGCDLGRWGTHITRKRLLEIENCRPFEVLNLGRYERQYWQGANFGKEKQKTQTEQALYEYLAFIIKLYGAQPVAGMSNLHGKKGKAMIHVGAVDAPVTIDEVNQAVEECVRTKQAELHVLGWEWEMGLAGPNDAGHKGGLLHDIAHQKGVRLLLLQIPREVMEQQAAAKGDVHFFELAYLEAEIEKPKKLTVKVALKDFVIPNTELIPEDIRGKVKKWSDFIDYWAIDWDFQNDTFMQGWVAYRTRQERRLPLVSDAFTYKKQGNYHILVKVIDIFGNDTSQAFDVEVK